jgi:hypothetical protein
VNLHIDKKPFAVFVNNAVVQAGVRQVKIDIRQAQLLGVEFGLLRDDLFNDPTD